MDRRILRTGKRRKRMFVNRARLGNWTQEIAVKALLIAIFGDYHLIVKIAKVERG